VGPRTPRGEGQSGLQKVSASLRQVALFSGRLLPVAVPAGSERAQPRRHEDGCADRLGDYGIADQSSVAHSDWAAAVVTDRFRSATHVGPGKVDCVISRSSGLFSG
jgi:hypothetical protein